MGRNEDLRECAKFSDEVDRVVHEVRYTSMACSTRESFDDIVGDSWCMAYNLSDNFRDMFFTLMSGFYIFCAKSAGVLADVAGRCIQKFPGQYVNERRIRKRRC